MDGTINSTTPCQFRIRGVADRIDVLFCNVASQQLQRAAGYVDVHL